ncbi:hypothetical protein AMTRI_Chr09g40310 [Amborella trichopoda]
MLLCALFFLHLCCPEPCYDPIPTSTPRALLRPNSSQQPFFVLLCLHLHSSSTLPHHLCC